MIQEARISQLTPLLDVRAVTRNSRASVEAVSGVRFLPSGFKLTAVLVDPTTSHTYKALTQQYSQTYLDGSQAIGTYATDDLSFAGISLHNVTFGSADHSSQPTGTIGLGPDADLTSRNSHAKNIPSTLDTLVSSGVIDSKVFSVWLNDFSAQAGSILFGGIDESKFNTEAGLVTLDMLVDPTTGIYDFYLVSMTNLSTTINGKTAQVPLTSNNSSSSSSMEMPNLPVVADTGASPVVLPPSIFDAINSRIGAVSPPAFGGEYVLPCSQAQNETFQNSVVSWTLGDPKNSSISISYNVSLADLVVPVYVPGTKEPIPGGFCGFGLQPNAQLAAAGIGGMGDPLLRQMFIVYDQDNKQVSFGHPNFNATGSKAVNVGANSTIPDVVASEPSSDASPSTSASGSTPAVSSQSSSDAGGLTTSAIGLSILVTALSIMMVPPTTFVAFGL